MIEFAYDVSVNIFSDILAIFLLLPLLFFIVAQLVRNARRAKLRSFLNLTEESSFVTVFISRHTAIAQPPIIELDKAKPSSPYVDRLVRLQQIESQSEVTSNTPKAKEFTAVSAIEMIEFLRLKESFERPLIFDWLPREVKEALSFNRAAITGVQVKLEVCPEPNDYHTFPQAGTLIFIGGPRANLGTYYFLFGQQAGEARPRRMMEEKEIIEITADQSIHSKADKGKNLALIQRYKDKESKRVVIYLAGTGVQGTAMAVVYLRRNWATLHAKYGNHDFCIILECDKRKNEDLNFYLNSDWNDDHWLVRKR